MRTAATLIVMLASRLGYEALQPPADEPKGPQTPSGPSWSPKVEARLLAIGHEYKSWTRVSDHAHWSPLLCAAPQPNGVQWSDSKDEDTHGQKLYFLFAWRPNEYPGYYGFPSSAAAPEEPPAAESRPAPLAGVTQALVKQSWAPVEIDKTAVTQDKSRIEARGDHVFTTGEQKELFVMYKGELATPGADEGWVYATMNAEGTKVLSAGRLESCMECHTKAKYDRQFGLPWTRSPEWESEERRVRKPPAPAKK
jgi:hypothetical protein